MANISKYTNITLSKTGIEIPVFQDGKTVDSKYNPEREADKILETLDSNINFFIVLGMGSGILIEKLLLKYKNCKIICIESSYDNIIFLKQLKIIQLIGRNENLIISTIDDLEKNIINNYIPAKYGNIKIIQQIGWTNEYHNLINIINEKLNKSIGIVSSDYSVQCHFGKIWQKNILNNLKLVDSIKEKKFSISINKKTALVVAAGPSLDNKIEKIIKNRDNYFIIATDTAYPVLLKNNIIPEIVLNIDGQFISHNHYFHFYNNSTIFLLDLCSAYSIGKKLIEKDCNIIYFISGHPFSTLINYYTNTNFISLFSGAGTVTITALDLAIKLGFKNIILFGADFSYQNGKAYVKGTYFDSLFGSNENKLKQREVYYDNLMYRTELLKIKNNSYTTKLLNSYKSSFEQFLKSNKCTYINNNFEYIIENNNSKNSIELHSNNINYNKILNELKNLTSDEIEIALLPYIAWLRNQKKYKNNDFNSLLKLAQSLIVSYN